MVGNKDNFKTSSNNKFSFSLYNEAIFGCQQIKEFKLLEDLKRLSKVIFIYMVSLLPMFYFSFTKLNFGFLIFNCNVVTVTLTFKEKDYILFDKFNFNNFEIVFERLIYFCKEYYNSWSYFIKIYIYILKHEFIAPFFKIGFDNKTLNIIKGSSFIAVYAEKYIEYSLSEVGVENELEKTRRAELDDLLDSRFLFAHLTGKDEMKAVGTGFKNSEEGFDKTDKEQLDDLIKNKGDNRKPSAPSSDIVEGVEKLLSQKQNSDLAKEEEAEKEKLSPEQISDIAEEEAVEGKLNPAPRKNVVVEFVDESIFSKPKPEPDPKTEKVELWLKRIEKAGVDLKSGKGYESEIENVKSDLETDAEDFDMFDL
jgi:hypothetical protein